MNDHTYTCNNEEHAEEIASLVEDLTHARNVAADNLKLGADAIAECERLRNRVAWLEESERALQERVTFYRLDRDACAMARDENQERINALCSVIARKENA